MKIISILTFICLVFGDAFTAPVFGESQAFIVNYENNLNKNGDYNFSFKTSNGIKRSEYGNVINTGSLEFIRVSGEYSYVDPVGELVTVGYYADETGFHILPPRPQLPPTSAPPVSYLSPIFNPHVIASLLIKEEDEQGEEKKLELK